MLVNEASDAVWQGVCSEEAADLAMTLGVNCARGSRSLSWTAGGVMIPTEERASEVFRKMFMGGSEAEVKAARKE